MTKKEMHHMIFKIFFRNSLDAEELKKIEREIKLEKIINRDNYNAMEEGITANLMYHETKKNRNKYSEIMYHYNNLLHKMSLLAKELNIKNSLELSILFSYLLWNGYLSKNRKYEFNSKELKRINGLFFADIMDGRGVCLNHSDMLKDFLNTNKYRSIALLNHLNFPKELNYKINISRVFADEEPNFIKKIINEILLTCKANHVFNLIEDNNGLYIFDSTNLLLQSISNYNKSKLVNGTDTYKLYPFQSYMLCTSKQELELLDKLVEEKQIYMPYTKHDLIAASEVNIELLNHSTNLLKDFYTGARPNIMAISKETSKIKIKTI